MDLDSNYDEGASTWYGVAKGKSLKGKIMPPLVLRAASLIMLALLVLLDCSAGAASLELTQEERDWLKAHDGSIRIAYTPDWPPMDFKDEDGKATGMVADYIDLIEKKLNVTFRRIDVDSWQEVLELARQRKIDVISAGQETRERREYMTWSTPYLVLDTTIIVRKSFTNSLELKDMRGMTIAVPQGYAVGEFIREEYPYLTVVNVRNSSDGMKKVSFGELDAMVTEVPNAIYIIDREKITNLRLAGGTGFQLKHGLGIRNDWPIFVTIIEKTLASISKEESLAIHDKWIRLETGNFYQSKVFWYTVLAISASAFTLVSVILLWNRMLKVQVMQRTEQLRNNEIGLEALLELNEQSHATIQQIIEFAFNLMIRLTGSSFGYLAFDDQDGLLYIVSTGGELGNNITSRKLTDGLDRETIGFWGEAVRRRKPVVSNDYKQSNPEQRGVPASYSGIARYMNVPIFSDDKVILVVGMGNKPTDYTTADLRQLNLLAQGMWRLIQRKKSEATIKKGEKRFQNLVDHSPNGIVIIQDDNVVYRNSRQIELTGDLDFFTASSAELVHEEDREKLERFLKTIRQENFAPTEVDFRFYTGNGQDDLNVMRWVNCIAQPLEFQERHSVLIITIDMTKAKELERLLIVQDKMASLGHVSAGIAHEIRNPLSGININLRTIEKNLGNEEKKEKVENAIEAIRSASGKVESVIRRVMNFAKPTEPKFKLVDLNAPVREAVALIRVTLRKKGVDLQLELDERPLYCLAEPQLIEEVVLNLLNNGADALVEKSGEKIIRLHSSLRDKRVEVAVEDNGPGIPRDLREKIFEPFFTTKKQSTGIGLSLCHRIITDHKGILRVVPSELGGAKFLIDLPAAPAGP